MKTAAPKSPEGRIAMVTGRLSTSTLIVVLQVVTLFLIFTWFSDQRVARVLESVRADIADVKKHQTANAVAGDLRRESESSDDSDLRRSIASIDRRLSELSRNGMNAQGDLPQAATAGSAEVAAMGRRVNYSEVMMDRNEIDMVLRYLNGKRSYLEWGSGGSTVNFPQFVTGRAASIEHFEPWCNITREMLRTAEHAKDVDYHCVPVDHKNSEGRYVILKPYVDEIARLNQTTWEFVLIDGRARVACALKVLSYLDKQSVVVVHDFERLNQMGDDDYSRILQYYDVLDRSGDSVKQGTGHRGIGVLRRKKKLDWLQGRHSDVQTLMNQLSRTRSI